MHLDLRQEFLAVISTSVENSLTVISTSVELTRHLDLRRQRTSAALDLCRGRSGGPLDLRREIKPMARRRSRILRAFSTEVEGILDGGRGKVEMSLDLRREFSTEVGGSPRRRSGPVEGQLDGGRGTSRPPSTTLSRFLFGFAILARWDLLRLMPHPNTPR